MERLVLLSVGKSVEFVVGWLVGSSLGKGVESSTGWLVPVVESVLFPGTVVELIVGTSGE